MNIFFQTNIKDTLTHLIHHCHRECWFTPLTQNPLDYSGVLAVRLIDPGGTVIYFTEITWVRAATITLLEWLIYPGGTVTHITSFSLAGITVLNNYSWISAFLCIQM